MKTDLPHHQYDTIIIGAGASGLFCAINVAKHSKSVLVLDHANKAGKKILMSGGGRCNFTNLDVSHTHFISQNPHFVRSALSQFTPHHFLEYVYRHEIAFHEKSHGQLFCDESSKDILNMLLAECQAYHARIQLNTKVNAINRHDDGFVLDTSMGKLRTSSLVIATGGLSIPTLGASGFGYRIAEEFGHEIVPTTPSLVPFTFTNKTGEMIKSLSGTSLDVVAFNDKARFELPMLFTHRGLSGPAMLQLSNYWQVGESIWVDLLPNVEIGELLLSHKNKHPKQKIRSVLMPYFTKNLLSALESHFWQHIAHTELANIKDNELRQIGKHLNAWQLKPSGTEGYRVAEVTKGGVSTKDIHGNTMQSRLQQGLYFIGEVLDVTGHLGGYNFQWAWSSAYVCAMDIVKK